jgi:RNA polymerase sigma factor (sigma-70 family)
MKKSTRREKPGELARFTDTELISACLKGDSTAWEALLARYQRLIYSIPIKRGFSSVDTADVFQSVCVLMLEKLASLREYEKISSWLITTTTRECWRVSGQWKRESSSESRDPDDQRDTLADLASSAPLAFDDSVAHEQQQILREAIETLPERCRQLISMLFYDKNDPSYVEIARQLKMPVASVGPTRARCLEKLKKALEGKI